MSKKLDRKHCIGCRDNFYNHTRMGLNESSGRPECWSLATAKMASARDVPVNMPPPYSMPETKRPNCYKASGYVRVTKNQLDSRGYWKV